MRLKVTIAVTALAAALLAGIAGCGGSSGGGGGDAGVSTLRIAVGNGSSIDSFNPLVTSCFTCQAAFRMMYPYLVQYNTDGSKIEGDFATSFQPSSDNTVWTFKTRKGATWSDGKPLTAEDAAWTLQTLLKFKESAGATFATWLVGIKSVKATDPQTLVVTYEKPTGTALVNLSQIPILPQHIWQQYATGDGSQLTKFSNEDPVTGGPFELSKAAKEQYALFAANPDYYGPEPSVKGFGFQFFKSEDAVVNAVSSHETDAAIDVTTSAVKQLESQSELNVETLPGMDVMMLVLNSSPHQEKNHELQNPQVREAFDLALNRANMVKVSQNGYGTVTGSLLPPALKAWSDPSLAHPEFNVAKANEILDSLGFKKGSDGTREAEGHPMSYQFPYPSGDDPRLIQIIVNDFAAIGVKLNPVGQDISTWIEGIQGDNYAKFDMSIMDYGPTYDPSAQMSLPTCEQWGGLNLSGACNKAYDKLFGEQLFQDEGPRHKSIDTLQQMVAEERPILPLYARDTVTVSWSNVKVPLAGPLIINYESKDWLLTGPAGS